MRRPITVLKLGSSVLGREDDLPRAAGEIARALARGERVVAVVSAFGGTTESLLARAAGLARRPEPTALAALLATGERTSSALLAIALEERGLACTLAEPERIALRVAGPHLDADPLDVDAAALRALLDERPVAVVPGFFARRADAHVATLGRGGSDLTALFLAERLGARCLLVKDVDGVYDGDPNDARRAPSRFASLSYADALLLSARVVQEKALRFAEERDLPFVVGRSLSLEGGTTIWSGPTEYAKCPPNHLTNVRRAVN